MAELRLDIFQEEQEALKHPGVWEDVLRMTRTGKMPPPGSPMPSTEAIEALASWIESRRESMSSGLKLLPGRVTARRLNRVEYNNSIRDLLGVDLQPADTFPVDDSGYGFDNIGDVLSLSPLLMENTSPQQARSHVSPFGTGPGSPDRPDTGSRPFGMLPTRQLSGL